MTQPTDLTAFKRKRNRDRASGKTLCKSGFHRWQDEARKQFEVSQGTLVSVQRCERCGQTKTVVS